MSEPVGALRVDVAGNVAQFQSDMAKIRGILAANGAAMQKTFADVSARANAAAASIAKLGTAAGALALVTLTHLAKASAKYGAAIDDNSQKLGMNVEQYQELAYAAKLAGMEQEDFQKNMEMLTRRLGEVNLGGSEAEKALGKLGLKLSDLRGKNPADALRILADRLKLVQDPMQRNALLADLFGRSGVKMGLMLQEGAAGLNKMAVEARALGIVLSKDTIEKAAKLDDEFDRLGMAAKVAGVNLTTGLLPAVTELRKIFASTEFQEGVKTAGQEIGRLVKLMVDNAPTILAVTAGLAAFKLTTGISKSPLAGALAGAVTGVAVYEEVTKKAKTATIELTPELEKLWVEQEKILTKMESMKKHKLDDPNNHWIEEDKARYEQLGKSLDVVNGKIAELQKKREEPSEKKRAPIDVNATEEMRVIGKAMDEMAFKTQLAKGEFRGLTEGFPEFAHSLKLFGMNGEEARKTIDQLPPALQRLHEAFKGMRDAQQIQTIAKGIGDAFGSAFENAIVEAKSFQEVLRSLYKDLLRVLVRNLITQPLGNAITGGLTGIFGGFGGLIPGRAGGGPVEAGQLYEVGERGRELFMPTVNGNIIPNDELRNAGPGGGGTVVNVDARGADQAAIVRLDRTVEKIAKAVGAQGRTMVSMVHAQQFGVQTA